jgi:hypothetical protein
MENDKGFKRKVLMPGWVVDDVNNRHPPIIVKEEPIMEDSHQLAADEAGPLPKDQMNTLEANLLFLHLLQWFT